jgi:hypothetical protein
MEGFNLFSVHPAPAAAEQCDELPFSFSLNVTLVIAYDQLGPSFDFYAPSSVTFLLPYLHLLSRAMGGCGDEHAGHPSHTRRADRQNAPVTFSRQSRVVEKIAPRSMPAKAITDSFPIACRISSETDRLTSLRPIHPPRLVILTFGHQFSGLCQNNRVFTFGL